MNYSDKILELNPTDTPMCETDYYRHMLEGGYLDNIIDCKVKYLETLGFIRGTDKVNAKVLSSLGYIHNQYFRDWIAPLDQEKIQSYLDEINQEGIPVVSTSHISLHILYNKYGKDRVNNAVEKYFKDQ